eukprot:3057853-Alexandrium_andersonii.AAC.1
MPCSAQAGVAVAAVRVVAPHAPTVGRGAHLLPGARVRRPSARTPAPGSTPTRVAAVSVGTDEPPVPQ